MPNRVTEQQAVLLPIEVRPHYETVTDGALIEHRGGSSTCAFKIPCVRWEQHVL